MTIIEVHGGPITHQYLMRKRKDELACMYMRLLRETDQDSKDAARYRRVRRGQHWSVIDGAGDELRGEELDAAVDSALAAVGGEAQG